MCAQGPLGHPHKADATSSSGPTTAAMEAEDEGLQEVVTAEAGAVEAAVVVLLAQEVKGEVVVAVLLAQKSKGEVAVVVLLARGLHGEG